MTTVSEQQIPADQPPADPAEGAASGPKAVPGAGQAVSGSRAVDRTAAPYLFMAAQLRHQITTGVLRAGARLPSSRELEGQFGHANMTVRRAVDVLRAEGLIYTIHGVGSFVAPPPSDSVSAEVRSKGSRQRRTRSAAQARQSETGLSQQLARLTERVQALETALWGSQQSP